VDNPEALDYSKALTTTKGNPINLDCGIVCPATITKEIAEISRNGLSPLKNGATTEGKLILQTRPSF
jgi:hypothetical protein